MLKNVARFTLIIILAFSAVFGYAIKDLKFNYVFESFFPTNDPDLAYYQKFQALFENDNDYLLIGLVHHPSIFDSTFLNKVNTLSATLTNIPHVSNVSAITDIKKPLISPAGYFEIPFLHVNSPERYKSDSILIHKNDWLTASFVANNATATAIFVEHLKLNSKEEAEQLLKEVRAAIDNQDFKEVHLAGKVHAQNVFIDKMQHELMVFLSVSILLVVIFLLIAFRSWWGVLIPLSVVVLATVWILGLMALMQKPIDFLMVLLPTIMFVVGMSDVVHFITKYIEQLRIGETKKAAVIITLKEVGLATFLTSLTTAVGFATLLTASILPIREFGIYTAIGVFIAYIVTFTMLPALFILMPRPRIATKHVYKSIWSHFLSRSFSRISRNSSLILITAVVLILLSLYGISKITINTYLIDDLPKDDPLKEDFTFFDQHFGGTRPFELTVTVINDSLNVFDKKVLQEIETVHEYLKKDFKAGNISSPVTAIKVLNQAVNGGSPNHFRFPETAESWRRVEKHVNKAMHRAATAKITAKDHSIGRISMRIGDIGSALSLERTKDLKEFIQHNTDTSLVKFTVTGTSNLIDKNNVYLANNMFKGLGIAFFIVAIIVGLLFRSLRMILITLIPNLIPLLLVAAIMGFFGITLKLSTSIVFTIAFGIAVDDTLHLISKFKIELNKGKSLLYALKRTYLSTGKAIVITTGILSGGFLILILSSFGGTFYTGLLVSLTLIFALLIDLTLLPVMIMLFYRKSV